MDATSLSKSREVEAADARREASRARKEGRELREEVMSLRAQVGGAWGRAEALEVGIRDLQAQVSGSVLVCSFPPPHRGLHAFRAAGTSCSERGNCRKYTCLTLSMSTLQIQRHHQLIESHRARRQSRECSPPFASSPPRGSAGPYPFHRSSMGESASPSLPLGDSASPHVRVARHGSPSRAELSLLVDDLTSLQ